MEEELSPVLKRERLTKGQLDALMKRVTPESRALLDVRNVSLKMGAGIISASSKCCWTKSGHRITFFVHKDGSFLAHQSERPDPLVAPHRRVSSEVHSSRGEQELNSEEWRMMAHSYAIRFATKHGTVTSDDVRYYMEGLGLYPQKGSGVYGAVFDNEVFVEEGRVGSTYPSNHGRSIIVWKLRHGS